MNFLLEKIEGYEKITDPHILKIFDKCKKYCEEAGYKIYNNITLYQTPSNNDFGWIEKSPVKAHKYDLVLNTYILDGKDDEIINTILHELVHYISYYKMMEKDLVWYDEEGDLLYDSKAFKRFPAHGKLWKEIAEKVSEVSGQELDTYGKPLKGSTFYKMKLNKKKNESIDGNDEIKNWIKECEDVCSEAGYTLPAHIYEEDTLSSKLGCTKLPHSPSSPFIIQMNTLLKTNKQQFKCTLLHELAHVIQFQKYLDDGLLFWERGKLCKKRSSHISAHDYIWQTIAIKLGKLSGIPNVSDVTGDLRGVDGAKEVLDDKAKWIFKCPKCGNTYNQYRRSKFIDNYDAKTPSGKYYYSCAKCGGAPFIMIKGEK